MSIQQQAASVASQLYDKPSTDNAGLITAAGVGALLAALLVVTQGDRILPSRVVLTCMAVYAAGSFTMAVTHNYVLGLAGFVLNGFAMSGTSLTINTTVLTHAEPRFRGRAISFYLLAVMGGIPLGAMGIGLVADHFSMRAAILGMGALMVVQLAVCLGTGAGARFDDPVLAS
jgi:MFS family permease